ncbi:hypothetical protein B296_00058204 [Ensete ventricosum]|uniref:Uncharacterized protein n=1 Tax=Ensete ventricosum TaxID=4639 RepID=A0A426XNA9_ENSVE|nr:hypothetical protein B296_00058204 [Ensete ventricosum]
MTSGTHNHNSYKGGGVRRRGNTCRPCFLPRRKMSRNSYPIWFSGGVEDQVEPVLQHGDASEFNLVQVVLPKGTTISLQG